MNVPFTRLPSTPGGRMIFRHLRLSTRRIFAVEGGIVNPIPQLEPRVPMARVAVSISSLLVTRLDYPGSAL
jgi:hypothetical protein